MRRPPAFLPPPPGQVFPPLRWLMPILAVLALAVGVLALRVMLPKLNLSRNDAATQAPLVFPEAPARQASSPAQVASPSTPPEVEAPIGPLSHHALGPVMRFRPKVPVQMPIEPLDARSFRDAQNHIQLAHVITPALQAICRDEMQRLWHCGIEARAGLYNRIRQGTLACRMQEGGIGGAAGQWTCEHGGEELALVLIRLGWARPEVGAPFAYFSESEAARSAKRGLWNGGWTFHMPAMTPSPPEVQPPAETSRRPRRKSFQPSGD